MIVIGSCLSQSIAIRTKIKQSSAFRHLRSDLLLDLIEGGSFEYGCPDADLDEVFFNLTAGVANPRYEERIRRRLEYQTWTKFEKLVNEIESADVIIFDNNYDLSARISEVKVNRSRYKFCNVESSSSQSAKKSSVLTAREMTELYVALFKKISELNPKVQIFFFNYPLTGFENRANKADVERVAAGRELNRIMKSAVLSGRFESNFSFVGCIDLPDKLLSPKGAWYFEDEVYHVFSELIDRKSCSDNLFESNFYESFESLLACLGRSSKQKAWGAPSSPYVDLPDRQYWKPAVAEPYPLAITDLYRKRFEISSDDSVATCGSCFAQHIGKRLHRKGYNYIDVEPRPVNLPSEKAKALGYGIYSARYGNVYTSRQLLQLFQRSFDALRFDDVWQNSAGRYVDPFRPNLCGAGYESADEVRLEQEKHLAQVRHMFETLDVFVFTMGLTETWINRETGAVYPICPGVTAGTFDPERDEFVNLDYATILEEMETFLRLLHEVNQTAKVLLTVSPVPLTATAEDRHVLLSTMASKAILRSVADQLYRRHSHVDYFPSYDIIMSPPYKSMFFKNNLRSIHEEGVDYVMSHFFAEHRLEEALSGGASAGRAQRLADASETIEEDDEAFCDEAFLEMERKAKGSGS